MQRNLAGEYIGPVMEALRPGRKPYRAFTKVNKVLRKTGLANAAFRLLMAVKALSRPTAFGVTAAVFDGDGRVLLVWHRYMPGWKLPGGGGGPGEAPVAALMREMHEEVGLTGGTAEFFGLYTRKVGIVGNVIALYRVTGAAIAFRPNLEIAAVCFADPLAPPEDTSPGTLRRLAELTGRAPPSPHW